ncbi:hypothetical protein OIU78_030448 [Salix suchowensis]|nr:hypothetical protein OIU78_030448 [Salix suchowensis]
MTQLYSNMRQVKEALKKLHKRNSSHISRRVAAAKIQWDQAQFDVDRNPSSEEANMRERNFACIYNQLARDEEAFFKQRSRIQWLTLGDRNTAFFHRSLIHRQARNKIIELKDGEGRVHSNTADIGKVAEKYFRETLGEPPNREEDLASQFFKTKLTEEAKATASLPFSDEEIKGALFSIPDSKSPGPDGFTSFFFKTCWNIIGEVFTCSYKVLSNN